MNDSFITNIFLSIYYGTLRCLFIIMEPLCNSLSFNAQISMHNFAAHVFLWVLI